MTKRKQKDQEKKKPEKVEYAEWVEPKKVNGIWRMVPAEKPY